MFGSWQLQVANSWLHQLILSNHFCNRSLSSLIGAAYLVQLLRQFWPVVAVCAAMSYFDFVIHKLSATWPTVCWPHPPFGDKPAIQLKRRDMAILPTVGFHAVVEPCFEPGLQKSDNVMGNPCLASIISSGVGLPCSLKSMPDRLTVFSASLLPDGVPKVAVNTVPKTMDAMSASQPDGSGYSVG